MMINFVWFLSGAVLYSVLSKALSIRTSIQMLTHTLVACLSMAKQVDEQNLLSIKRECDAMENNGASQKEIDESRSLHIRAQYLWRAMMIGVLDMYCPARYKKMFNLKDWQSAMKLIKK